MILPDVNVLIEAIRPDAHNYVACRQWLESVVNGDDIFGMSPQVLSSVARIMTNSKMVPHPYTLDRMLEFSDLLIDQPHCRIIQPGPRHWRLYCDLCRRTRATGNLIPDAWFAALAIESGCEWVTLDRDFRRFDGLRWRAPF
jgi:hypothetical protein